MTREEFLQMVYRKSKSASSAHSANYALESLKNFSLEYSKDLESVLEEPKQINGGDLCDDVAVEIKPAG